MAPANPPRRVLSRAALPIHLSSLKVQDYIDTLVNPPSSRPSNTSLAATGSGSGSNIRSLAWSPLGSLIATADLKVLRVWNPEKAGVRYATELKIPPSTSAQSSTSAPPTNGRPLPSSSAQRLVGTERVAWNPTKEAELASVGSDGVVRFWDVRNRAACVGEVKVGGEGFSLTWAPDGDDIVVGRKDDVLIRLSRAELRTLTEHPQTVQTNQIAFSNAGTELYLSTGDSSVKILDYPSMTPLHTLTPQTSSCTTLAPSPSGRHIATGGSDALLTIYGTHDLVCNHTLSGIAGPIRALGFSFDGSFVAGASDEVTGISVAHVESGDVVHEVKTQGAGVTALAWAPSRYALAWGEVGTGLKVLGASAGGA